jgi:tetratricopeptide (TPR) repeat protein
MPMSSSIRKRVPGAGLARAALAACFLSAWAASDAQAFWGSAKKEASEAAAKQAGDLVREADAARRAGDGDAAVALYRRAIDALLEIESQKSDVDMGPIRFRRAYCETQIDQIKFDQASKNERRVTVTSVTPPAAPSAAEAPAATGAVATAASRVTGVPPSSTNAPALVVNVVSELAWARDMIELGRQDEAAATLIRVLKFDPAHRAARLMLATVRCRQGAYADALIILEDLRGEREDEAVLLALSGAYCGATRYYEALLALDRALAVNPRNAAANMNMAYLLLEMSPGRQKESELYYRQAVKLGAARDAALERRLGF